MHLNQTLNPKLIWAFPRVGVPFWLSPPIYGIFFFTLKRATATPLLFLLYGTEAWASGLVRGLSSWVRGNIGEGPWFGLVGLRAWVRVWGSGVLGLGFLGQFSGLGLCSSRGAGGFGKFYWFLELPALHVHPKLHSCKVDHKEADQAC